MYSDLPPVYWLLLEFDSHTKSVDLPRLIKVDKPKGMFISQQMIDFYMELLDKLEKQK